MPSIISPRNKLVFPRSYRKQPKYLLDLAHPLSRGLVGCWPLGDSPNSINRDLSPFGRDMLPVGTPASASPGSHHGGLALSTNAQGVYLETAFPQTPYPVTMTVWANLLVNASTAGYMFTLSNTIGASERLAIISGNNITIQGYDGTNERKLHTTGNGGDNIWRHYAFVAVNSSTYLLYIDGVLQSLTADQSGNPVPSALNQANIGTLVYSGGNFQPFGGLLEGARVYNRALTQDEISLLFAEPYAGLYAFPANLVGAAGASLSVGTAAGAGAAAGVGSAQVFSVGAAVGAGLASGVALSASMAVGTAAGAGAATGFGTGGRLSIGSAVGAGQASASAIRGILAVGSAAGAGSATATPPLAPSKGVATGAGSARGAGHMVGRILPFDIDRAWAVDINGDVIDAVQYDPITLTLRVIYVLPLTVDVGNMPMSITNTIGGSPDPQGYTLGLVAAAAN